jgi:type IV pilus assembly protein PilM
VIEQFEELFETAGRQAMRIDFHSLCLYNYYQPRLELGDEYFLVGVESQRLNLMYFSGQILVYQRVREMVPDPEPLFRELSRSLTDAAASHPAMQRCPVFTHLDPGLPAELREVLESTLEREVRVLDPQLKRFAGGASLGLPANGAVLAAISAAEQLMIS